MASYKQPRAKVKAQKISISPLQENVFLVKGRKAITIDKMPIGKREEIKKMFKTLTDAQPDLIDYMKKNRIIVLFDPQGLNRIHTGSYGGAGGSMTLYPDHTIIRLHDASEGSYLIFTHEIAHRKEISALQKKGLSLTKRGGWIPINLQRGRDYPEGFKTASLYTSIPVGAELSADKFKERMRRKLFKIGTEIPMEESEKIERDYMPKPTKKQLKRLYEKNKKEQEKK